jgi:hypothetical protein
VASSWTSKGQLPTTSNYNNQNNMKKTIMAAACTVLTLSAFGQGYIDFQNFIATQFYFNSTASTANKVTSGTIASQPAAGFNSAGVVDVGLYWSTAMFTDPAQGTLLDTVTMSATPGTIAGNSSLAISGTSPGQQIYVQVFAWDSAYSSPDAALAEGAYFGASSAGQANMFDGLIGAAQLVTLGAGPPAPGAPIFGTAAPLFPRTVLLSGPEPGTIAICGLGAAALLVFRRRK